MSPTTIFTPPYHRAPACVDGHDGGGVPGVVGGWVYRVGAGRGYTVYPGPAIPGPIFNLILRPGPTYGQMKLNYEVSMRFPR